MAIVNRRMNGNLGESDARLLEEKIESLVQRLSDDGFLKSGLLYVYLVE